eukprot:255714-Prymnesium_polylepis.2
MLAPPLTPTPTRAPNPHPDSNLAPPQTRTRTRTRSRSVTLTCESVHRPKPCGRPASLTSPRNSKTASRPHQRESGHANPLKPCGSTGR